MIRKKEARYSSNDGVMNAARDRLQGGTMKNSNSKSQGNASTNKADKINLLLFFLSTEIMGKGQEVLI